MDFKDIFPGAADGLGRTIRDQPVIAAAAIESVGILLVAAANLPGIKNIVAALAIQPVNAKPAADRIVKFAAMRCIVGLAEHHIDALDRFDTHGIGNSLVAIAQINR